MKKTLLLLIFTLLFACTQAQNKYAYIKFKTNKQTIKDIHEEKGIITTSYSFTNTGEKPLIINSANTSTSRISIEFPKEPILPGKKEKITIKYNPIKKRGEFNRTITIMSNAKNRISVLYIKGNVIPRPLTLKEQYPTVVNNLRYKRNQNRIYLNDVKNTKKISDTVHIYNHSKETLNLEFKHLSSYITIQPNKLIINPEEKKNFIVTFDASQKHDYGYVYERLQLYINGKHKYKNDLTLNANIIEDFSNLSNTEKANAPKVVFETTRFEFGNIKEGDITKHTFNYSNKGKSDLVIRKIRASCGCTAVTSKSKIIKAGESSKITVTFNSKNKRGRQHKFIHIICNDPSNHTIKLEVIGNITPLESNKE